MSTSNDDIYRAIGQLEGTLKTFMDQMKIQDDRATNLEVRIRTIENKQYWLSGATGILGTIAGALGLHVKW